MAMYIFTKAILEGRPIDVYNNSNMERDFTFIDDIVVGSGSRGGQNPRNKSELDG
jgi:nucleoside-diphosphate-sugar epimerase